MPNRKKQLARTGEVRTMNNGMDATLIEYLGFDKITVQFSDGTIIRNRCYGDFKRGEIANTNYRVGLKRKMNCGKIAMIVRYRNARDIDVQFEEDGYIVEHRQYNCFEKGKIKHP